MITLIRPILFSFIQSPKVKRLIVDLLRKMATTTDNTGDDTAVDLLNVGYLVLKGCMVLSNGVG